MPTARPAALPQRVVGIGASAGGLEALKQLIARAPTTSGLAFVVLQHLPPSQTGQLAELLAPCTSMPVIDCTKGQRILPDTVLVVPPRSMATLSRGSLVVKAAKDGGRPHLPIDGLFQSLASTLHDRAVGIVLSGTGHDGTEGLRAIQASGGVTFAQDPATAQFDEMPRSAIAAAVAELVLAPAQIGDEIESLTRITPVASDDGASSRAIARILALVRTAVGVDFSGYKRTTIERRIARRLAAQGVASLDEYAAHLEAHPQEARALFDDLLIHVTSFFRDPEVLDSLSAKVLTELVRNRPGDAVIRVWVPGCSTGEEVYTLAILLFEQLGDRHDRVQVFGTDLSERALATARAGTYSTAIEGQVSADRLKRYFVREDGKYRIHKSVRERCLFVHHNLLGDPPFSRVDLVSCRNVLIYLGVDAQRRVMPTLHYALNQPGYLLLGRAETIAGFEHLFAPVDGEARIYSRRNAKAFLPLPSTLRLGHTPRTFDGRSVDLQRDVDQALLSRYAPACVVVDDSFNVIQFRGRTGMYLEQPPGRPEHNLLRLARKGLARELPGALLRAARSDAPVRRENVAVGTEKGERVHVEISRLGSVAGVGVRFLVVFEPAAEPAARRARGTAAPKGRPGAEIKRLRDELHAAQDHLQNVVAQQIVTTEELNIANEELQSSNEELQSTNEELQTAKEELQSTNEELENANEELQRGNARLREVNDDLTNVLASSAIAIIIVDTERRIRRFTPQACAVMNLVAGDIGRPIGDLQPRVEVTGLDASISQVIETLELHESEVRHRDGRWFRMQIRPYRTTEHVVCGAVIALIDITVLRSARELSRAIVEAVPAPLVVLDHELRIHAANRAFETLGLAAGPPEGRLLLELGAWSAQVGERLRSVAQTARSVELDAEHRGLQGQRTLHLISTPLPSLEQRDYVLVGITDMTAVSRLEVATESARREREAFLDAVSHELRTPLAAIVLWAQALKDLPAGAPEHDHAVTMVLDSARAEAELVDDLLELSQSRSSTLTISIDVVDVGPLVEAVVAAARPEAVARGVRLEITLASGARIAVDPKRFKQIVTSLVSNAVKFTPDGGTVRVSTSTEAGTLVLRVADTGPGIPDEFLPRIFQPFAQADGSITRAHRGLGISLALVRHLVERQRGSIVYERAAAGTGATFAVRFDVHA